MPAVRNHTGNEALPCVVNRLEVPGSRSISQIFGAASAVTTRRPSGDSRGSPTPCRMRLSAARGRKIDPHQVLADAPGGRHGTNDPASES